MSVLEKYLLIKPSQLERIAKYDPRSVDSERLAKLDAQNEAILKNENIPERSLQFANIRNQLNIAKTKTFPIESQDDSIESKAAASKLDSRPEVEMHGAQIETESKITTEKSLDPIEEINDPEIDLISPRRDFLLRKLQNADPNEYRIDQNGEVYVYNRKIEHSNIDKILDFLLRSREAGKMTKPAGITNTLSYLARDETLSSKKVSYMPDLQEIFTRFKKEYKKEKLEKNYKEFEKLPA